MEPGGTDERSVGLAEPIGQQGVAVGRLGAQSARRRAVAGLATVMVGSTCRWLTGLGRMAGGHRVAGPAGEAGDVGRRLPAVGDLIFFAVLIACLGPGRAALMGDPGIPWHVQVGVDVWQFGPPRADGYSFTRLGRPWLSQHWLFDAASALLYRRAGWDGLLALGCLLLAWTYWTLYRTVLESGANVGWAVLLTLLAAGCGAPNWLARPHLVSLLFCVLVFRWCWRFHRLGGWQLWCIPPLMALWSNLHGGFLAGLVIVGSSVVGHGLSRGRVDRWRVRLGVLAAVLAASALATLCNPYGWRLHAHLLHLLFDSGVRGLILEWGSADFAGGEGRPFEALILLTVFLLAVGRVRPRAFAVVHLLVWLHLGLASVRGMALAGLVLAPIVGAWTVALGAAVRGRFGLLAAGGWLDRWGRSLAAWAEKERGWGRTLWPVAASVFLLLAVVCFGWLPRAGGRAAGPSPSGWPVAAVERLNHEPAGGRVFHTLEWGGYLILKTAPRRPVFIDDRFELYGGAMVRTYLAALSGGPAWQRLVHRYRFRYVLLPPRLPLARHLISSSRWQVLHSDSTAVLLRRRADS